MDRGADARIGAASANVGEVIVDILVGRLRELLQKSDRRHDLSRLAIAALRHVIGEPSLLYGMRAVGRKTLDRGDILADDIADRYRQERIASPSTWTVHAPH